MNGLRIAQLANFVGPTSGGMRTAIEHVGQGYVEAGAERIVITHPKLLGGEGAQYRSSVATGVGALYRILSRTYDAVVVTSRYAAAEFDEVTTPLVRIPLGVDLDTFRPSLGEPVDDGVLKLVHAGRLSREKSPHLAVATGG
jgi:alpha-1,6-mannosyltransferase